MKITAFNQKSRYADVLVPCTCQGPFTGRKKHYALYMVNVQQLRITEIDSLGRHIWRPDVCVLFKVRYSWNWERRKGKRWGAEETESQREDSLASIGNDCFRLSSDITPLSTVFPTAPIRDRSLEMLKSPELHELHILSTGHHIHCNSYNFRYFGRVVPLMRGGGDWESAVVIAGVRIALVVAPNCERSSSNILSVPRSRPTTVVVDDRASTKVPVRFCCIPRFHPVLCLSPRGLCARCSGTRFTAAGCRICGLSLCPLNVPVRNFRRVGEGTHETIW